MEYAVIYAGDFEELERKVNTSLGSGWRPQGGVGAYTVMQPDGNGGSYYEIWYMQAIVKETGK